MERTIAKIRLYYYAKLELHFSTVLAPTWPSYHVSSTTLRYGNKSSPLIASDVTAAMLVERTIAKISLYYNAKLELHFSIVLAPTWPSYHVSAITLRYGNNSSPLIASDVTAAMFVKRTIAKI